MKLVRFFVSALLIGAVISFTACSDDEDEVVNSSTDEPSTEEPGTEEPGDGDGDEDTPDTDYGEGIHFVDEGTVYFADGGETVEIGLVSTEAWTASVDVDWVTVSPTSGDAGESDEVQTLTLTAERNTEANQRVGTLTVTGETDEISLTLRQDPQNIKVEFVERVGHLDCYFGYAYYTFSYSGVTPGDEITVTGTVTGTPQDISIPKVTVIAEDSKGTVDVPFQVGPEDFDFSVATNTPLTQPGTVDVSVDVSVFGTSRLTYTAKETVYIVCFDCSKFTMGGDYVGHNAGVMPAALEDWPIYRAHSSEVDWLSDFETVECDWNQPAFVSILDWTNETGFQQAFNVNRGSSSTTNPASETQWYGTRNYSFYKQMAMGSDDSPSSAGYGSWVTPILYPFMNYQTTGKVKVSVDLCPGITTTDLSGTISIRNVGGTRTDNLVADFSSYLTEINSEDDLHWTTITCEGTIEDSTTEFVRIQSSGSGTSTTSTKYMRNFLVELAE